MMNNLHSRKNRQRRAWLLATAGAVLALGTLAVGARHRGYSWSPGQTLRAQSGARLNATLHSAQAPLTSGRLGSQARGKLDQAYAQLPLSFEANQGQTDRTVNFLSRGKGYSLFLTGDEAILRLKTRKPEDRSQKPAAASFSRRAADPVLRLRLVGADTSAALAGRDPLPGKVHYFLGNDRSQWRTNVPTYARVQYRGVYPGVDLVYYGNQGRLEHDFVVAPGADPGQIAWALQGVSDSTLPVSVDSRGNLRVEVGGGTVRLNKPVAYEFSRDESGVTAQNRHYVDSRYTFRGNGQFGFSVPGHDASKTLVIDPVLVYSTFLGGSLDDEGASIAVDSSGNAYVTGQTLSTNFPTLSAQQGSCASCGATSPTPDAFVTKLDAAGTALVYSTYLGGGALDAGLGIAVDSTGNAYVTGQTFSTDFPSTAGAFQTTCGSCSLATPLPDAFVAKLDTAGSLVYSTFLGGNKGDQGIAIAADSGGNAYVTGSTSSTDFAILNPLPAPNNSLRGASNVFVAKFDPAGGLLNSTYLGGSDQDIGYGIAVDSSGIYVVGQTNSNNFPTVHAWQSTFKGVADAFISKLAADGSSLIYSTYLGGTLSDGATAIAVDSSGDVYVTGATSSSDFPTSAGTFQTSYGGGPSDAFVAKLDPTGAQLLYSTYLGGNNEDSGNGIAVDTSGNANIAGNTASPNFPTVNPVQATYNSNTDAFVTRLAPTGCAPTFSTYLGGHSTDVGTGIAVDSSGNAYVTGRTSSNDFPLQTPFQATTGGSFDAFVTKLPSFTASAVCLSESSLTFSGQALTTTSSAQTIMLSNGGTASLNITSISASGDFGQTDTCGNSLAAGANCTINVTFTPTSGGNRTGAITITDDGGGSPQSVALAGVGSNFAMTVTPTAATVTAGQPANYTLTLTPVSGFTSAVQLTCSGNPTGGTCTISPSSLTLNGTASSTATVTVTTAARTGAAAFRTPKLPGASPNSKGELALLFLTLAMVLVLFQAFGRNRGFRPMSRLRWGVSLMVILALALWPACGFTSNAPTGTPAGNYTLTITGTAGTLQNTLRANLAVN